MKFQKKVLQLSLVAATFAFSTASFADDSSAMKALNSNNVDDMMTLYEDLDQDGVTDAKDQCPNTAQGSAVGPDGCTPIITPESNTVVEEVTIYEPVVEEKIEAPLPEPVFTMNSTFFDFDKSSLRNDQINNLRANLSKLSEMKATDNLLIMGHTCDLGPDAYNMRLSWRRASTVEKFIEAEMPQLAGRVYIVGRGEADPLYPNTSEANREKNRRVEIRVLPGNQVLPADAQQTIPAAMMKR